MSVKVAVRVRPFNQKEIESQSSLCINMNSQTTVIKDQFNNEKSFAFDYSFWSHDGFVINSQGYAAQHSDRYYDQQKVFDCMGKEILDNAWEGYNCCLFAYGQTGSGKSYSMVGYGANKGIVPISCEEIFFRINSNSNCDKSFEVLVSMLEIYNEKVQDLLVSIIKRPSAGLKVRESKTLGVFVDSLSKHAVTTYEQIAVKMEEGYHNRTIGTTLMNATSSRAHTIVTIEFKQILFINGKKSEKISVINLVDLAGSERAGSTGATGDRLKEGCNINKSLLALGNVINTLADKAMGKRKDVLPPYRDSALTRILQTALGGNSKTVMICALSPASINYEETVSTLRYADRVKKIQNKAIVNESGHDKVVRLLREENGDLKKMIEDLNRKIMMSGGLIMDEDKLAYINLKEQYEATNKVMIEMEKTFEEKLAEANEIERDFTEKVDIKFPHLVVLNEDPQISHKLKYTLKQLPVFIGRKYGDPSPQITMSGIGIKINHAKIVEKDCELKLLPNDKEAQDYIFINGRKMPSSEGIILKHKDRITFGTNSIFLYMVESDGEDIYSIDWEQAQHELHQMIEEKHRIDQEKKKRDEIELMKRNLEEKFIKERQEVEEKFKKQLDQIEMQLKEKNQSLEKNKFQNEIINVEKEFREQLKEIESTRSLKKKEIEKNEKIILLDLEENKKIYSKNKNQKFEQTLRNAVRKINKLKIICSEFNRNICFVIKIIKEDIETNFNSFPSEKLPDFLIKVENFEEGTVYYWNIETFYNRYDMMKELFEKYQEEDIDVFNIKNEEDPLWDKPKRNVLGYCFYKLEPLAFLLNNESSSSIISRDKVVGYLITDIIPIEDGKPLRDNENPPEDPYDLTGNTLDFVVYIKEAKDLPSLYCKDIQVEYECFYDKCIYKTKILSAKSRNHVFNEYFVHKINYIQKEDIDYLLNENICFRITGFEEVDIKGKIPIQPRITNVYLDNSSAKKHLKSSQESGLDSLKSYTNFKVSKELDIKIEIKSVPIVKSSIRINNLYTKDLIVTNKQSKKKSVKESKQKSSGCVIY